MMSKFVPTRVLDRSMSDETPSETEVQAKATRRRFTASYKRRVVEEAQRCKHGEIGALLRREGLYSTQLTAWRKQYEQEGENGLKARKRGPKAPTGDARELEKLRKENARLVKKLEQADLIIAVQKKLSLLFNINEENS